MTQGQAVQRDQNGAQRVPDFFVVGHPKCGTTAIYEMLRRHPQIYTATGTKETGFFVQEENRADRAKHRDLSLDAYLGLFAPATGEQVTGELTTSYLRSTEAARRIADLAPRARIVALFREPASFLRSLHMQLVRNRVETERDFRKALQLEAARREGRKIPPNCRRASVLFYSDFIQYAEQLRRFHAVFPAEQVLPIIYDDFRQDNAMAMQQILRFLGVDDVSDVAVFDAHPSVRVRSVKGFSILRKTLMGEGSAARVANRAVKLVSSRRMRQRAFVLARDHLVFGKPDEPDHQLMRELRSQFAPEVKAFGDYLGRDLLTLWGYSAGDRDPQEQAIAR
jgi:hypothetical protein